MITFTHGNLLDAPVEAIVNTVNTVGVMGKGIALMFKEAFPDNYRAYKAACDSGEVMVGRMFVTEVRDLVRPQLRYIVNFPTKKHWRAPSQLEWVQEGLADLRTLLVEKQVRSIAIPPLGSGNGGLDWTAVRAEIIVALSELDQVDVYVYEPTSQYQNVAKRAGVQKLTPLRALLAELIRRYSSIAMSCTVLEAQKLAYLLEREVVATAAPPLKLKFKPHRYGPYDDALRHVLDALDGSYIHCDRRLADAEPLDVIWFEGTQTEKISHYLTSEAKAYEPAMSSVASLINRFESPLGMELLTTVDWLTRHGLAEPTVPSLLTAIEAWPGGPGSGARKLRLFEPRLLELAIARIAQHSETVKS